MKNTVLLSAMLTLGIFMSVLYTSCIKDECESIVCSNGGTCVSGACQCATGYTGSRCEIRTCEANNTARVRFINKTGTSLTYAVIWDGSLLTTLGPGVTSEYFTVAAAQHTLHFQVANSGNQSACTPSTPVLTVCGSQEYWCSK